MAGPQDHHEHAQTHAVGRPGDPPTAYNWKIHHPFDGVPERVAVEVSPWRGLLPRWRFVLPADFQGAKLWGVGPPGGGPVQTDVKREAQGGPVTLIDGPTVVWFGGHESLSPKLSAYLVFEGEPPHYLAFGQAEDPGAPPKRLEGISFGQSHPDHPHDSHDHGH
ncbi:MAG: hypothetical protein WD208_06960 [Dehalococcoidia bacterium]